MTNVNRKGSKRESGERDKRSLPAGAESNQVVQFYPQGPGTTDSITKPETVRLRGEAKLPNRSGIKVWEDGDKIPQPAGIH